MLETHNTHDLQTQSARAHAHTATRRQEDILRHLSASKGTNPGHTHTRIYESYDTITKHSPGHHQGVFRVQSIFNYRVKQLFWEYSSLRNICLTLNCVFGNTRPTKQNVCLVGRVARATCPAPPNKQIRTHHIHAGCCLLGGSGRVARPDPPHQTNKSEPTPILKYVQLQTVCR